MKKIKLGYEIKTGKQIDISPSHLIVTGLTQLSGKTTTLEALIKRSGLKAIVFKTKIGEKSFTEGTETPPFFRDRSDYEFVKSLIEAYSKEKLFIEKGTLMRLAKATSGQGLIKMKQIVDEVMASGKDLNDRKLNAFGIEIYTRLQHNLENIIPQIQYSNLSKTLNVSDGVNIMNLERFSEEAQALIIQSVADEVLKTMKDTIIVIPEAWKFIPQKYNNPCKRVVESFIRQGATNNNFDWIDSQDMAGVDKIPLKQISTWILGYQSERNEVKHTLDQISLPKRLKPKEDEIMTLKKGHFILSCYDGVFKVYVQPIWMDDETAIKIAKGKLDVDKIESPTSLTPYSIPQAKENNQPISSYDDGKIRKQMIELRQDFFNKMQEHQNAINKIYTEIYTLQSKKHEVNADEIVSLVMQKMPSVQSMGSVNEESIISKILARIPKQIGSVIYEVAPLEKIKKDFLNEAKQKILSDISTLSNNAKRTLKYMESRGIGCAVAEICIKGFMYKDGGGGYSKIVNDSMKELSTILVGEKQTNGKCFGRLKERIKQLLEVQDAKPEEIEEVYNHILMELLDKK